MIAGNAFLGAPARFADMATTLEEEMSQLNQLLEAIEKDKTFVRTKISRSASIELSTKSPRASHHDLEDYMERWYSLLEAADSYERKNIIAQECSSE